MLDADEKDVITFLRSFPEQFVSGREVARRAGGKWKFRDDPHWAVPVLARLLEKGLIEDDSNGHYRFILSEKKKEKPKRWVSPQIKKMLQESGREFDIAEGEDAKKE